MFHECWRDLNKNAASGVDRITAQAYEQDLLAVSLWLSSWARGQGSGHRVGVQPSYGRFGCVVEADIKGFFDNIDHNWLLEMLSLRIDDRAFLNLIGKWLKAGIFDTDGQVLDPKADTPQGGIISPILANVYLHYALTSGSSAWSNGIARDRHCSSATRMIISAPFSIRRMPSGSTACYQRGWENSAFRWRRRRPASCASTVFIRGSPNALRFWVSDGIGLGTFGASFG